MHMNFIHAQASLMIIIGISFMSKHPWWMFIGILSMSKHTWWWWGFDQCTSILVDDHRDLINVSNQFFVIVTKIWSRWQLELSSWPNFCRSRDNSSCHRDQIFVTMTKNWSRDNSNCHRDQFFVIVTKFLSRWQKIGHATKNKKKTERKALNFWKTLKSVLDSRRQLLYSMKGNDS